MSDVDKVTFIKAMIEDDEEVAQKLFDKASKRDLKDIIMELDGYLFEHMVDYKMIISRVAIGLAERWEIE